MIGTRATPLECWKIYVAVKQHFSNKNYNLFDKGVVIRGTMEQLEERNDRAFFFQLSEEYLKGDLFDFMMANIMIGRKHPSEFERVVWEEWRSKQHGLAYHFEQDLKKLASLGYGIRPLFKTSNGKLPLILQALHGSHIMLDTICIIDKIYNGNIIKNFDDTITDQFIYPDLRLKIVKYQGFIRVDLNKFKEIFEKQLEVK